MLDWVSPEHELFPSVVKKRLRKNSAVTVEDVLGRLEAVRPRRDGWIARCPHHRPDIHPSLYIRTSRRGCPVLKCFAGCSEEDIWKALCLEPMEFVPQPSQVLHPVRTTDEIRNWNTTRAVYEYLDAEGQARFLVLRRVGPDGRKTFRQYRSCGPGLWQSGLNGTTTVPFRLPQLLTAVHDRVPVYIPEGEKDVLSLVRLGLVATCNPGGAGKWRDEYSARLQGADLILLPDNDEPGRLHVEQLVRSLQPYAASIRVVVLPDLPPGGDVSDWIAAGGTREQLEQRVASTPAWTPPVVKAVPGETSRRQKPTIFLGGKLSTTSDQAMEALVEANDPPCIFQRGSSLVRLETEDERLELVPLSVDALRGELDRTAEWIRIKETRKETTEIVAHPPLEVVRDILALPGERRPLPSIDAILRTPIFLENGSLVTTPGYHAEARIFYAPPPGFTFPTVPEQPSSEEQAEARRWIIGEFLGDFPFVGEASRAHALAALLEHPARRLIRGITPLHLFDAPSPGTGKTLLARAVCTVATFSHPTQLNPPASGSDEWDKRLTSVLIPGPTAILLDNIDERGLDSPALAAVLTTEYYSGRLLGHSREVHLKNASSWLATGNNVMLSPEVARRTVLCQIDAQRLNPEERTGFRHDPLPEWIERHRGQLYGSLCVMIRAWLCAGQPEWKAAPGACVMGSYERWCRVIGGILDVAGVTGFLTNRQETRQKAGYKDEHWQEFFMTWLNTFADRPVSVRELLPLIESRHLLLGIVKGKDTRALATSLGMALRSQIGRVFALSLTGPSAPVVHVRLLQDGMDTHTRSPLYGLCPI